MAYCNECGIQLQDGVRFCHSCGAPAPGADPTATPGPGQSDTGKPGPAGRSEPDFKTELRSGPVYGADLENLPPGYVIDDRYEIREKVGQGGFGAAYRVHDRKMDIDKALKVLPKLVAEDKRAMDTLLAEARTMVRLNHPHIVRLYEIYYSGPIKYLDMEFVSGGSLSDRKFAASNKRLPEKEVRAIARQVAAGLAYAHRKGVIHKDIKPQNVLLAADTVASDRTGPSIGSDAGSDIRSDIGPGDKTGAGTAADGPAASDAAGPAAPGTAFEAKVMDFGISETVRTSLSRLSNTSSSGTLVYMSPEQIRGKDVGREADIYSFGAMLYELLSGHPPFYKGAIEHQILSEPPEPIDGISGFMNDFLLKCLEKDYQDRFRSFEQVMTALKAGRLKPSPASASAKTPAPASSRAGILSGSDVPASSDDPSGSDVPAGADDPAGSDVSASSDVGATFRSPASPGRLKPSPASSSAQRPVPDKTPASATDRSGDSPLAKKSGAGKIFLAFIILAVLAALGIGYVEHQKEQERVRARAEERYRQTEAERARQTAEQERARAERAAAEEKQRRAEEARRAAERAAAAKAAAPAAPASPDRRKAANNLGMEFVWIEPGTYMRGSPSDEPGRNEERERQHRVTLTKGFFMQTTEVTQGQWKAVMGNNPARFSNCGDNCPVEQVSWNDVQEFIRKLNSRTSGNYRLPTEAEWEYAARAGTTGPFYTGNCLATSQANYDGNNPLTGCSKGEYRQKTLPVKSFTPNAWGLYDMHGNVFEWCSDWYGDYPDGSVTDPTGPSSGTNRVCRGGSWLDGARGCRSARRGRDAPDDRYNNLGFRLAAPQVR